MTKEFSNGFWLTILRSDIKSGPTRKLLVNFHHPLIPKFIKGKIDSYKNDNCVEYDYCIKMKKRYVEYHIDELINIGRECVPRNALNKDYIPKTCARFMQGGANFRIAFRYILETGDPSLLFLKETAVRELRDDCSIVHFFLCLHQFYDSFDKTVPYALEQIVNQNIPDPRERVLIWALYVLVLVLEQSWIALNSVLENRVAENDPKLIISTSPGLYRFCKAISGYATGTLYTHASWLKESTDPDLIAKRKEALIDGRNSLNLQHLTDDTVQGDWLLVRKYFSVHMLLVLAKATLLANRPNVDTIREAFRLCKEGRNIIQNPQPDQRVLILEPVVYIKLAYYRSLEGDLPSVSFDVASDRYTEARMYHGKVSEQLLNSRMGTSSMAARNHFRYGILMRSWAYRVLAASSPRPRPDTIPSKARDMALQHLQIAIENFLTATRRFEILSHSNNRELLNCYIDTAETWDQLRTWTPVYVRGYREKCNKHTFRYYGKAYNLLRDDYRSCHLSANTMGLATLIERLPKVMERIGQEEFWISKVKENLKNIRDEASKAATNFEFSGSALFVYMSSEGESSDDDWFGSGETQLDLVQSLAAMDTSSQPQEETKAEQATSNFDPDEEASSSKKRKL